MEKRPFITKGSIRDVIKPKKRLFRIASTPTNEQHKEANLAVDLAEVLSRLGIVLYNVRDIARELSKKGWVKTIEDVNKE